MEDGLYRVQTSYFVAGFIIENNKPSLIAPILRKRFNYWKDKAELINLSK